VGLAYERHGSGPPLVLLHGVGHRRQAWNAVLDLLTPHRTVIAVDLPGHGESPPLTADGRPPVRVMAEEIIGFFGELGLERPHVAGNSLGGALALLTAESDRAATVTALAPAGFWASGRQVSYARAVFTSMQLTGAALRPLLPALARTTAGRAVIDAAIVARPGKMSPEQAEGDARAFLGARDAVYAVLADSPSFAAEIPVSVPVTIAWGTRDRLLPPSQARVARQCLPRARFVPLPGCGHVPMTDDPGLVARVLLDGSAHAHSAEAPAEPRGGSPAA
jgi:pimeloyl-ACP methyl ester carboxylesterase